MTTLVAESPSSPPAIPFNPTPIERSDAADALSAALDRQERMLAPKTQEPHTRLAADQAEVAVIGVGGVGDDLMRYWSPLLRTYALIPVTTPSTVFGESWEAARALATATLEPLVEPTPLTHRVYRVTGSTIVLPPLRSSSPPEAEPEGLSAYRAFSELATWLRMTQEETAQLLDIGRTTPLAWRRGPQPRPALARRLYQTHALVKTLVRRLGHDDALRWLHRGSPSPLEVIRAGDVTRADDLAEEMIFGSPARSARLDTWIDEPDDAEPPETTSSSAPSRAIRRSAPRRRPR
jgi:hypothetical protein